MRSKYQLPKDCPAAACGRCIWWQQKDAEGWGKCLLKEGKFIYKCMVCCEYEYDPDTRLNQ